MPILGESVLFGRSPERSGPGSGRKVVILAKNAATQEKPGAGPTQGPKKAPNKGRIMLKISENMEKRSKNAPTSTENLKQRRRKHGKPGKAQEKRSKRHTKKAR